MFRQLLKTSLPTQASFVRTDEVWSKQSFNRPYIITQLSYESSERTGTEPRYKLTSSDGISIYAPSVTQILDATDDRKKFALEAWRKSLLERGEDPEQVKQAAADRGTATHSAMEMLWKLLVTTQPADQAVKQYLLSSNGPRESKQLARMIMEKLLSEFAEVSLIGTEVICGSMKYKFGGTCDLIFRSGDSVIVADYKTYNKTKALSGLTDALTQCAMYSIAIDEMTSGVISPTNLVVIQVNSTDGATITNVPLSDYHATAIDRIAKYWTITSVDPKLDSLDTGTSTLQE